METLVPGSKAKCPRDSRTIMTELVLPHHTNQLGTVFGGTIMAWMDICGSISAAKHVEAVVVTASIDDLHFLAPVRLGSFVEVIAQVCYVGHTSVDTFVQAWQIDVLRKERIMTAQCFMTFAARDESGNKIVVPPLIIETEEDRLNFEVAKRRREKRLERKGDWPTKPIL